MEKKLIDLIEYITRFFDKKTDLLIRNVRRLLVVTHQSLGNKIYINILLSMLWFLIISVCAVNWRDIDDLFMIEKWQDGTVWQNIIIIIVLKYLLFYPILLLNIFFLIPKLWQTKQYMLYFLSIPLLGAYLTAIKVSLNILIPNKTPNFHDHIFQTYIIEVFNVFSIFVITGTIKYVYETFIISARTLVLQKRNAQLQLQLAELRVAQLKPHFLLNSLNNIDTLLLKKSDKAGVALQSLSDALKYVLYESDKEFLPLSNEIEHLENMIMLESLRFSKPPKVTFKLLGITQKIMIPTLLLTPLLENCFKWMNIKNPWISIDISVLDDSVLFVIENSRLNLQKQTANSQKKGGLGLLRLQERLKMLYPKHYKDLLMVVDENPSSFSVHLKIPLL
ncbi:MAG: sensor histidine kinase [Chitinophagales bacterium]